MILALSMVIIIFVKRWILVQEPLRFDRIQAFSQVLRMRLQNLLVFVSPFGGRCYPKSTL